MPKMELILAKLRHRMDLTDEEIIYLLEHSNNTEEEIIYSLEYSEDDDESAEEE